MKSKEEKGRYNVVHEIKHSSSNRTLVCVIEKPIKVRQLTFPSQFYEDGYTKELNKIYDVKTCPDEHISSSLGDVYAEIGAQKFLAFSKFYGRFLGIERNSLMGYLKDFYSAPEFEIAIGRKLVRILRIEDLEILFPTAELLENQGVREKG